MRDQPICSGCGSEVAKTQRWCERCVWSASDIRAFRRSARLLRQYGFATCGAEIDAAIAGILEQLRTGKGPARDIAEAAAAGESARRRSQARFYLARDLAFSLHELMNEGDAQPLAPAHDPRFSWLLEFAQSLEDGALTTSPGVLLPAARRFIDAELERIVAGGCTCGHRQEHPEGVGCLERDCGCGSPARARRAAADMARGRKYTDDDLLGAWPRLPG